MDLPEEAERAPSAPVWNQSFPSPKVQVVHGALFRNIRHNLSGLPRERLPPSATRRTRPYAVVPQRGIAMTIMQEEAAVFGLQINWSKTKILQVPPSMPCSTVQVADGHVEMVDAFVYLGSMIDSSGGSRGEVLRRISIARSCMNLLEKKKSGSQASSWILKYASTRLT